MDHLALSAKGGRMLKEKNSEQIVNKNGKKVNKYFSDLARKSGKAKLKKYGTDYFKALSRLGVEARRKKAESKKTVVEKVVDAISSI